MKSYNGISGGLKIFCALFEGLLVGGFSVYGMANYFPFMGAQDGIEVVNFIVLLLAIAGYAGMLTRGISQIKMLFRPDKENEAVAFCIDVLSVIFIIAAFSSFIYYSAELGSEEALVASFLIYVISVILTIIDAVILFIKIKKEKIKIFNEENSRRILSKITKVTVPLLVIGLIVAFKFIIAGNLAIIKINESLSGGFDSFTMSDFDGNEYTEDMFKGHKITMVNIWGTFCRPCIQEMPEIEKVSEMYDERLQIVGLTSDLYVSGNLDQGKMNEALDIIDKTGAKYTMLIPSKEIQAVVIGSVRFYPTTLFFDENGNQIKMVEGSRSKEGWIEIIEEVMPHEE